MKGSIRKATGSSNMYSITTRVSEVVVGVVDTLWVLMVSTIPGLNVPK